MYVIGRVDFEENGVEGGDDECVYGEGAASPLGDARRARQCCRIVIGGGLVGQGRVFGLR